MRNIELYIRAGPMIMGLALALGISTIAGKMIYNGMKSYPERTNQALQIMEDFSEKGYIPQGEKRYEVK